MTTVIFHIIRTTIDKALGRYTTIWLFSLLAGLNSFSAWGQSTHILDWHLPGTYTYTVPAGVEELVIECWGAGGGGTASIGGLIRQGYGAGGGGGAHAHDVIKVQAGQTYTFTVGRGGKGGERVVLAEPSGENGGDTFFATTGGEKLIIGEGGRGALYVARADGGAKGGDGGSFTNSKGLVIHPGGNGADAGSNYSGGGGGAAGRTHGGYSASGWTAGGPGSCYCGIPGRGGNGRNNTTGSGGDGDNGYNQARGVYVASGGGGGGFSTSAITPQKGGNGANGHVRIKEQAALGDIMGQTYVEEGDSIRLTAPVPGGNWRSSLANIATVDANGMVRGLTVGEVVISYHMGDFLTAQSTQVLFRVYPAGQSIIITGQNNVCTGQNIILTASAKDGSSDKTWYWTKENENFIEGGSGIDRPGITANAGKYTVTATNVIGSNLVTNGNFSSGNTGFTSDYSHNGSGQSQGQYNVFTRPRNSNFSDNNSDHTTGTGNYLSLMGNNTANAAWKQTITVQPNTYYQFSYWMQALQSSALGSTPTNLEVKVLMNNVQLGKILSRETSKISNGWVQYTYNWFSGSSNSVNVQIRLNKNMLNQHMLGLDDISFYQVAYDIDNNPKIATADIDIVVANSFTPSVQIISVPEQPQEGLSNTFVARALNVGRFPTYQWYINGVAVSQDPGNAVFTSNQLLAGDKVSCQVFLDKYAYHCPAIPAPYLSQEIEVIDAPIIKNLWIGLVSDEWAALDNWTQRHMPDMEDEVEFATEDNYGYEALRDLRLTHSRSISNYTNYTDKKLIVAPEGCLRITGGIDCNNNNRITVEANTSGQNGSLILPDTLPAINTPLATVELYSKANINPAATSNNQISWQYIGIPVQSLTASPSFNGAYMRAYDESKASTGAGSQWNTISNTTVLLPFKAYEIAQTTPITYALSGKLVKDNFSATLAKTAGSFYSGQHLLANPYTAGLDITALNFGAGLEKTVYLYQTGSFIDWQGGVIDDNRPGSYLAVPQNQAVALGIPDIPSMQAFLVRVVDESENCTFSFNYSSAVPNTQSLRSATAGQAKASAAASLQIRVESEHYSDQAWVFIDEDCKHGFDNGWDGYKFRSTKGTQVSVLASGEEYQVCTTNQFTGLQIQTTATEGETRYRMRLLLQTGNETLSEPLVLIDQETGEVHYLTEGENLLSWEATDTGNPNKRFVLQHSSTSGKVEGSMQAFIQNKQLHLTHPSLTEAVLRVYDSTGSCLLQTPIAEESYYTVLDFPLPAGVYILQLKGSNFQEVQKLYNK